MKKLVLVTLVISNIAYAGVCENGHYIEHEKCANIALDERNAIDALTQEVPQEEQKKEKDLGDFLMGIFLE